VLQSFALYCVVSLYWFLCFCSNAQSRTATSKGTVRCHFHVVIVKSDFDFKQDKDFVAVKISEPKLGGWNSSHIMSVEK